MKEKNNLFENLKKECTRAIEGKCRDIAFEVYGKSKMAFQLGGITQEEFDEIHGMFLTRGLIKPWDKDA